MDLYGDGISLKEEQKQRLLDNSERIERSGNHLNTGYQILLETEEIGSQVLRDLNSQRETIQKSRSRVSIQYNNIIIIYIIIFYIYIYMYIITYI